jgi:peroxiredoxin/tetratricopeptide (TPR) repeat protein
MLRKAFLILCILSLLLLPAARAQAAAESAVPAGHSVHGEAFNEGPRQKAYLMGTTGRVSFPVTTQVPLAQAFFNQGIGQLHGFWYYEAERSFRQVAALDPDCAMAYWGMAMANVNNAKRAKGFIQKAVARKDRAGRREQLWIDSLAAYYRDESKPEKDRRKELVRRLEDLSYEFPDDIEAKAFLAVQIWLNGRAGWPVNSQQAVHALLKEVLAVEPMHPAHHYVIHIWDDDKAARAVSAAARCGQSAPGIAHQWHMSGHTFAKLHRHADAAWQQEASARVDHAHMMRDRILPDQIHNYAHNNQWLVESLGFVGRVREAIDLARNMIELPRHPRYNSLGRKEDGSSYDRNNGSAGMGRNRLLEVLTNYELWDELLALAETTYLEPTDLPAEQAKRLRALGVASFAKGDREKARQQIAALEALRRQVAEERLDAAEQAESKARKEKQPDDKAAQALTDALRKPSEPWKVVNAALAELRGHEALAEGKLDKAKELFEQAGDIPKERLARAWLRVGDTQKAAALAREIAADPKNRVHLLANAVDILHRCGAAAEAKEKFNALREISGDLDLDLPVAKRLAPLAAALNLPTDWRLKKPAAPDVGERPNLADLGPFRWQPSPAPEWSLADARGRRVSLEDYRGRPVVMIFFLGAGCRHCLEQLTTFEPLVPQFAAAGISLVAVSTDPVDGLIKTAESSKLSADVPVVSDQELKVFKAYRAFDDFENVPLHGTFFLDGDGLVRWQDISYEPFKDARFLLEEAKRLLSLPKGNGQPVR